MISAPPHFSINSGHHHLPPLKIGVVVEQWRAPSASPLLHLSGASGATRRCCVTHALWRPRGLYTSHLRDVEQVFLAPEFPPGSTRLKKISSPTPRTPLSWPNPR